MSKHWVRLCYGFATLYMGRGGFSSIVFEIAIIFCKLAVWNLQKRKEKLHSFILFPKTHMCFNEFGYITVHSVINIMTAKTGTIIFLSYYYLPLVLKALLEVHNDKFCSLVKLLWIYFCYFILLNHG